MILLPQTKVLWIQRLKVLEISKCLKNIEQKVLGGGGPLFSSLSLFFFLKKESNSWGRKDTFPSRLPLSPVVHWSVIQRLRQPLPAATWQVLQRDDCAKGAVQDINWPFSQDLISAAVVPALAVVYWRNSGLGCKNFQTFPKLVRCLQAFLQGLFT